MVRVIVGVFALVASGLGPAFAQTVHDLDTGSRVRLWAAGVSSRPLIGTIVSPGATELRLQVADQKDPVVVSRDAITKLEASLGRRSRGRGAKIGALVGGAVGAIAVLATPEKQCEPAQEPNPFFSGCLEIISKELGAVMMGGVGAGLGSLIGLAIPPGERWGPVSAGLRVGVAPAQKGGVLISLSLAF